MWWFSPYYGSPQTRKNPAAIFRVLIICGCEYSGALTMKLGYFVTISKDASFRPPTD